MLRDAAVRAPCRAGWPLAIAYATGVALVLKLASSALQQKAIGQSMSGYVKVRQAVSVNSPLIKSMRLILGEKGLTIAKVGVLVGGPDWPVSVRRARFPSTSERQSPSDLRPSLLLPSSRRPPCCAEF